MKTWLIGVCVCVGILMLGLLTTYSHAQIALPDPGQRFLEQEQRKRDQERLETPPTQLERPDAKTPASVKGDLPCFDIQAILLEGNTLLSSKIQSILFEPYMQSCMDLNTINTLIHDITNTYIGMGYVTTRVYIPEQNLQSGVLLLKSVEGKVEDIVLNEQALRDQLQLKTAFPGVKGTTLQLKDLEQGLDQMNRLTSSKATLTMWPGNEVGGTKVKIENTPKDRWRGYATYDNTGQASTGSDRLLLQTEIDNLLFLNDYWSLYYIGSIDTNAVAMSANIPFGYWNVGLSSSYSEYFTSVNPITELFGDSTNSSVTVSRVVSRTQRSKAVLDAVLNIKESTRLINDVFLDPQPLTVIRLGGNYTFYGKQSVWMFDGHYSKGINWLGAMNDEAGLSNDIPRAQFNKLDAGVSWVKPFSRAMLRSSVRGQYSFNSLFSSEQLSLGDRDTIRGFAGAVIAGDSGAYSRNDLSFTIADYLKEGAFWKPLTTIEPYGFVDIGFTKLHSDNRFQTLAGTGLGLKYNGERITWDIALGVPIYKSSTISADNYEIYVTLTLKAF